MSATDPAGRNPWWHGWRRHPLRALALGLIRFYQCWISPLTPPSCRFYPSCSAYALTAVQRFGPVTGTWLATKRLCRCHPWNPGGVDHVPERDERGRPRRAPQAPPGPSY